jgi:ketosteroid isomerase-like protein
VTTTPREAVSWWVNATPRVGLDCVSIAGRLISTFGSRPAMDAGKQRRNIMTQDNEQIIRHAYKVAEDVDIPGWVAAFTDDGTFTDESIGVTYRGPKELAFTVENYAKAFPDMHREIYRMYVTGDIVVVQLALQGTHLGPLSLTAGTLKPTGKRMDTPCCDVFELSNGKIKRFDCYPSGSVTLTQLGVIGNLEAATEH